MGDDTNSIERLVLVQLMHLNGLILGLTTGLLCGIGTFITTIILLIKGGDEARHSLALLGHFFIGYQVSILGSLIGFVYGLIFGFLAGYMIAGLYNWMADFRENAGHEAGN